MSLAEAEAFFGPDPFGPVVFERVRTALAESHPDAAFRVSKSQIAFRRRRGFAFLWRPGRYLRGPTAPVVLSIAMSRRIPSDRFTEVVHPGPWMHHLEVRQERDLDDEVMGWLREAADEAG